MIHAESHPPAEDRRRAVWPCRHCGLRGAKRKEKGKAQPFSSSSPTGHALSGGKAQGRPSYQSASACNKEEKRKKGGKGKLSHVDRGKKHAPPLLGERGAKKKKRPPYTFF